ncbi:MAG: hypothetical protein ACTHPS_27610 [Streptosporangiaceae bacterium]
MSLEPGTTWDAFVDVILAVGHAGKDAPGTATSPLFSPGAGRSPTWRPVW